VVSSVYVDIAKSSDCHRNKAEQLLILAWYKHGSWHVGLKQIVLRILLMCFFPLARGFGVPLYSILYPDYHTGFWNWCSFKGYGPPFMKCIINHHVKWGCRWRCFSKSIGDINSICNQTLMCCNTPE
jgi:hypothetical protein